MKPRSGSKSVTFSDTSTLFLVDDIASSSARRRLWFTRSELGSFKANARDQTRAVRRLIGSVRTPGASDVLGMERFLTHEVTREYVARRRRRTHAVLDEARFQRAVCANALQGRTDALSHKNAARLAIVSANESRWARERAQAAALFLEQDQKEERRRCLKRRHRVEEGTKVIRPQAQGTDRSPVDLTASVEWGHRSSLQETVWTRSRCLRRSRGMSCKQDFDYD